MNVKIGPSFEARRPGDAAGVKPSSPQANRTESRTAPAAADVRLSDLSTKLADLEARLAGSEAFDTGRVDELKQAISEGRFKVNPEAVADKLITSVQEMLARKAG